MRYTDQGGFVTLALSRKNLEYLLDALTNAPEQAMLSKRGDSTGDRMVSVFAEENDTHYERRQTALEQT